MENEAVFINEKPSFFSIMWKEIYADKTALVSLIFLCALFIFLFIAAPFMKLDTLVTIVDLRLRNNPPSLKYILGTDSEGRDVLSQLIVGARNSVSIAMGITLLAVLTGTVIGLAAGFYGGLADNIIMRLIDSVMMLPILMMVLVIVAFIPGYNVQTFMIIVSALGWMSTARLIRVKTLQQCSLDYVSAAKTLGTSNLKIMFTQVLPNIISIVIVNLTLNLAFFMGLEVGLSFLGFGPGMRSLGTLLARASSTANLTSRLWLWLPAALLILVIILGLNFIGQAIKRAANAEQRLG